MIFKLIHITKEADFLQLALNQLPQWDEFIPWAEAFLSQLALNSPFETNEGADRHMLVFTFNRARFSLNYESYCESVWIAAEEEAALTQLDALELQLKTIADAN